MTALSWQGRRVLSQPAGEDGQPAHLALQKPWIMLRAIRQAARAYLFDVGDPGEYYQGLALYLLGALRFKNLAQSPRHPLPKQIAFCSATLACQWLVCADKRAATPELEALLARAEALWSAGGHQPVRRTGRWRRAPGPRRMATRRRTCSRCCQRSVSPQFVACPPARGCCWSGTRAFLGRHEQLQALALAFKAKAAEDAATQLPVAVAGLGGGGKTQLV